MFCIVDYLKPTSAYKNVLLPAGGQQAVSSRVTVSLFTFLAVIRRAIKGNVQQQGTFRNLKLFFTVYNFRVQNSVVNFEKNVVVGVRQN
jgi:hypothetical protein